jgi:CheY-like chemotaxis protein
MAESKGRILWVDDEVDLLRPHIIYLTGRGFEVETVTNGEDAVVRVGQASYDLMLLDESMPGLGGLETLERVKQIRPALPVVMVTKNEEEELMEEAIGRQIADYLTKPVNPTQILSVLKKHLEGRKIVGQQVAKDYIREFQQISMSLQGALDLNEWIDLYRRLTEWQIELDEHPELGLKQTMADQMREGNSEYSKFFEREYRNWLDDERVTLSPSVVERFVIPRLGEGPVFFFVIDCMRYDQWLVMEQYVQELFRITREFHIGIIPTATPYARNAIFSGYYPVDFPKLDTNMWRASDDDDYSMNKSEKSFLEHLLARKRVQLRGELKYHKIHETEYGKQVATAIGGLAQNSLTAIVVNFVDMIAHGRSDSPILKEIAPDEAAYRSLTRSWFSHSSLLSMFQQIARIPKATVIVTTDHGSVRCMRGARVLGDRETSTNLRYKYGRNVKAEKREAMYIAKPEEYRLPHRGAVVNYVIAKEDFYFVYPNDYNKYLAHYRDSFQHGGISMEETILPVITLESQA